MSAMTLEELKRKNAEAEAEVTEAPQAEEAEEEVKAVEVEQDESTDIAEESEEESSETDAEAWMVGDDQASQDDSVPLHAHTKLRSKLKAKLSEKDDEIAQMRAEIEALKSGSVQQQAPTGEKPKRPKLEDYDYDEDAYAEAMDEYQRELTSRQISALNQTRAQAEQQRKAQEATTRAVDEHYQRAQSLVEKNGISPDLYRQADQSFREVFEQIAPGNGDAIADGILARIGDGSEKVAYAFGRNKELQAELKRAMADDPTGLKAAIMLGKKAAEFEAPAKRTSRAPAPAPRASGGDAASGESSKLQRKYAEASKKGDLQAAFDARRAAKKAGIDVSKW